MNFTHALLTQKMCINSPRLSLKRSELTWTVSRRWKPLWKSEISSFWSTQVKTRTFWLPCIWSKTPMANLNLSILPCKRNLRLYRTSSSPCVAYLPRRRMPSSINFSSWRRRNAGTRRAWSSWRPTSTRRGRSAPRHSRIVTVQPRRLGVWRSHVTRLRTGLIYWDKNVRSIDVRWRRHGGDSCSWRQR